MRKDGNTVSDDGIIESGQLKLDTVTLQTMWLDAGAGRIQRELEVLFCLGFVTGPSNWLEAQDGGIAWRMKELNVRSKYPITRCARQGLLL